MTGNKQLEKTNNIDQIEEVLGHLAKKDKRMIVAFAPSGNPMTVQTSTSVPSKRSCAKPT